MADESSLLNMILLGNEAVGKSSLVHRYVTNKFNPRIFATIGVDYLVKKLEVDNHSMTVQIMDTACLDVFKRTRILLYKGYKYNCCLLIFSVGDSQSFQNLSNWKREFVDYADVKDPEHFPFVILGNKVDISECQVSKEEAVAWCRENGNYSYFETSAIDGTNVSAAFEEAIRRVLAFKNQSDQPIPIHNTVNLSRKPKSNSTCV